MRYGVVQTTSYLRYNQFFKIDKNVVSTCNCVHKIHIRVKKVNRLDLMTC